MASRALELQKAQRAESAARDGVGAEAETRTYFYDQLLDHDAGEGSTTYRQRYHVDSSLAGRGDAPVLFYICGEWDCGASQIGSGAIRRHAAALGAHLVALEHRFYGQSLPFATFSTDNLRYLTTTAALKDAARFQRYAIEHHQLSGKWIAVGASYSANLAAYYRQQYPELVVGALASSAPVRPDADFNEYDRHVATVAGEECAATMRRVVTEVETAIDSNPERLAEIKAQFAAERVENPVDFLYILADTGAIAVQYGLKDRFCNRISGDDPVAAYGAFAQEVYAMWGVDAVGFTFQGMLSEDPGEAELRPWYWQSCTEYGYWQNAWPDATVSVRSQRINAAYHDEACRRMFGPIQPVDTSLVTQRYYRPLLQPQATRILFTNGSVDPWSVLSLTPGGVDADANPALELVMIEGAAHCDDLQAPSFSDSAALVAARRRFVELARTWLE